MNHEPNASRLHEAAAPAPPERAAARARNLPAPVFPVVLAILLAIAVASVFVTTHAVEGLPGDPSARAAREVLSGCSAPAAGELRFGSVFFADSAAGRVPAAPALGHARVLLERAREAHPFEPRVVAALGHLELAQRRLAQAEALYERAIDLRSHCTEARLGLGVTLAVEADGTGDLFARRELQLRALAQFLTIGAGSEREREALYDRAVMEERVGRHRDAVESARAFLALEPAGAWAERLRRTVALEGAAAITGGSGTSSSSNP